MFARFCVGGGLALCLLAAPPAPPAPEVSWLGISYPSQTLAIGAEQDGRIAALPVRAGERVRAGQVLFELSTEVEATEVRRLELLAASDARLREAKAALEHARREHERVRDLAARDMASAIDLAKHGLEVELAAIALEKAALEQQGRQLEAEHARARLAQRTIRSPIDGVVSALHHACGETIPRLEPVVELIALDPLWVELDCPLADEARFAPGARFNAGRAGEPAATRVERVATVVHAAPRADAASQTFRVRLSMDNAESPWKAGLKVEVAPLAEDEAAAASALPAAAAAGAAIVGTPEAPAAPAAPANPGNRTAPADRTATAAPGGR